MTADQIMRTAHEGMRDDLVRGAPYAHGAMDALLAAGLMTEQEHRLWGLAVKTCPGHNINEGGRVWCAFCGNLPPEKHETRPD